MKRILSEFSAKIQAAFPGFSVEALKNGRIPVATVLLEQALQKAAADEEGLRALHLRSEPGRFLFDIEVEKLGALSTVTLPVVCREFEYSREKQAAHFAFEANNLEASGQNLLGRLLATLPDIILLKVLRGGQLASRVNRRSEGAARLDWPELYIALNQLPRLQAVHSFVFPLPGLGRFGRLLPASLARLQGRRVGLLDLFRFGPLEIDYERVWLRVKFRLA